MDLLQDNIKKLYWKFLLPAVGGALVVAAYNFVDTIAIGQGVGPNGTAACAVFIPIFCLAEFIGLLCGIGGSVLMSQARGGGDYEKGNAYFTMATIFVAILTAVAWVGLLVFQEPVYRLFGADDVLMPYAREYGSLIVMVLPSFVFATFAALFVRNDEAPNLVMTASLIGAATNIFGDWLFVFPLDMGMFGAALATVIGSLVQSVIMGSYLFSRKCSLKFVKPVRVFGAMKNILINGFGAGFAQLAVIVMSFVANNQIMKYAGGAALAVYGMISTTTTLFTCVYSGTGQAAQPIASSNYGAGKPDRYWGVYRLGMNVSLILGVAFSAICLLLPEQMTRLFMDVTPEVMEIAPTILRIYALCFLPLAINTFLSTYLQSIMQAKPATWIAVLRGLVLNCLLLYLLPLIWDANGIWIAFVASECIVAVIAVVWTAKIKKNQGNI